MEYTYKEKDNVIKLQLTDQSIVYVDSLGEKKEILFEKIKKIFLSMKSKSSKSCKIESLLGDEIVIRNESQNDLGDTIEHNNEYLQFIERLHKKIIGVTHIKFYYGSAFLYYFLIIFFTFSTIAISLLILISIINPRMDMPLSAFLVNLILIPIIIKFIKTRNSGTYSPDRIPRSYFIEN